MLGNPGQQEVMPDQRRNRLNGCFFKAQTGQDFWDQLGTPNTMVFTVSFSDIVQQGRQEKPVRGFYFLENRSENGPLFIIDPL